MTSQLTRRFPLLMGLLVCTALFFPTTAFSSPGVIEADSYPAKVEGTGYFHTLWTGWAPYECGTATFEGELTGPSETLTVQPTYETCGPFELNNWDMRGCEYQLHFGEEVAPGWQGGSIDIVNCDGPSPGIKITEPDCRVTIPPQSGLGSEEGLWFEDGGGSVFMQAGIENIKYSQSPLGPGCPQRTASDALYIGDWAVQGADGEGNPVGISIN